MKALNQTFDERLDATVELAVQIAAGHLDARLEVSDQGDAIDAITTSLNLLAEELGAERESRKRAEELLRDEVEAYEYAPALFCSLDAASLVIDKCNHRLTTALEMTKEQILGRSVLELYQPACRDDAERSLRGVAPGAVPSGTVLRLQKLTGGHVLVDTSATRIRGVDGRERLRIVWRDVTAEKHLEAQLLQSQKMEAVGRLSGAVAHDFNNLLSVILGSATFLDELLVKHQIETGDVRLIQEAAMRGASLTNDLLAFSRRRVVQPVATDVRTLVFEAERMVRRLVGESIRVATEVTAQPLIVVVDPSQLSQVLMNLAINARDAMPEGGSLTIEAVAVELPGVDGTDRLDPFQGEHALIAVSDSGVGMAQEVVAQAFEPFFTTKPVGRGSGLGLSTCYGIVRQAGGQMLICSEPGRGTTVKIYLPLSGHPAAPKRSPLAPELRGGGETLLVVEDDAAVRLLTARILEQNGYRVLVAQNGADALGVAREFEGDIALVVTDVVMPEVGGRNLAVELRCSRPTTRVLFLSGYTTNAIVTQGVLNTGVDFLAKPFTPVALLTSVRAVLDRPASQAAPAGAP